MPGIDGAVYVLALCDANHCSEKRKDDAGNGKIVLMRKKKTVLYSPITVPHKPTTVQPTASTSTSSLAQSNHSTSSIMPLPTTETIQKDDAHTRKEKKKQSDVSFTTREEELLPQVQDMVDLENEHLGECIWETVLIIDVPKTAFFRDYSDMDITNDGKIIISTQEESAVWIGRLKGIDGGIIHPDELHFDKDEKGVILSFPMSDSCYTKYCNIEGIHVLNDHMIIGVSGIMQGRGQQDFRYVVTHLLTLHFPFYHSTFEYECPMSDFRCFDKQQSIHAFILP